MLVSVRKRTRTAGGIPASRTARDRTPGGFLLRRIAHWATASFAPQPCVSYCRFATGYLLKQICLRFAKATEIINRRKQRCEALFFLNGKGTGEIRGFLKLENDYEICRKMLGKGEGTLENTGI